MTGRAAICGGASAPPLTDNQRRFLRGRAHELKPIIQIGGAGVTDAVVKETGRALDDHELIKVRARGAERAARDAMFTDLAARTGSSLVHRIGHVAVLYRPRDQGKRPGLLIPDL
ncbi:MAG TPA: ribosome assembly RNA-binding protein YhbY [Steroidobacteraceae bacterium]|nr:ribosome assembly RNA-binding protein YhbY [Steroidobacteraceae bacterium]